MELSLFLPPLQASSSPPTAAVAPTALLLMAIVPSPPRPSSPLQPATKSLPIGGANSGENERSPSDGSQNHFARSLARSLHSKRGKSRRRLTSVFAAAAAVDDSPRRPRPAAAAAAPSFFSVGLRTLFYPSVRPSVRPANAHWSRRRAFCLAAATGIRGPKRRSGQKRRKVRSPPVARLLPCFFLFLPR